MNRLLQSLAILLALGVTAAAQNYPDRDHDRDHDRAYAGQWQNRMSVEDQQAFNREYDEWQRASARNDRDDVQEHARRMEDIMARYNIPPRAPFDVIASSNGYGAYQGGREYQRFSADDQRRFDRIYDHWLDAQRKHDRDDIEKDEHKMQDIMGRYNIPRDVPYDELATNGRGY